MMASTTVDLVELQQRVDVAECLLSTLIAILSARDPRLLQQLQAVFAGPDFASNDAGRAAAVTWERIAGQLKETGRLVDRLGKDPTF